MGNRVLDMNENEIKNRKLHFFIWKGLTMIGENNLPLQPFLLSYFFVFSLHVHLKSPREDEHVTLAPLQGLSSHMSYAGIIENTAAYHKLICGIEV